MSRRINITIGDDLHEALRSSSRETGASIGELVRRAIEFRYRRGSGIDSKLAAIKSASGIWSDRGDEIYEQIRAKRIDFRGSGPEGK